MKMYCIVYFYYIGDNPTVDYIVGPFLSEEKAKTYLTSHEGKKFVTIFEMKDGNQTRITL